MSLPSRLSRLVSGSSWPGVAGSGICFTQTATFMPGIMADAAGARPVGDHTPRGGGGSAAQGAEGDVRHVGDDAVDAEGGQRGDPVRIVDRPGVDREAGPGAALDKVGAHGGVVRVE